MYYRVLWFTGSSSEFQCSRVSLERTVWLKYLEVARVPGMRLQIDPSLGPSYVSTSILWYRVTVPWVLQSPYHVCYLFNSLCLPVGPGAGHCLALLRLAHLDALAVLLETQAVLLPLSACRWFMRMVMSPWRTSSWDRGPQTCCLSCPLLHLQRWRGAPPKTVSRIQIKTH